MTDEPTNNPCELADELKSAIFKYEDRIPLALAVGVLRIVEQELIDGHR